MSMMKSVPGAIATELVIAISLEATVEILSLSRRQLQALFGGAAKER